MRITSCILLLLTLFAWGCSTTSPSPSETEPAVLELAEDEGADEGLMEELPWDGGEGETETAISDPLESVNRVFFVVNDRLFFWVLKPVASGYAGLVPEPARVGVHNFFTNVATPVRLGNCLLQGKFDKAGTEVQRFLINTTIGVAGFGDPALHRYGLSKSKEDLGQTLGHYGLGHGFYVVWPFAGPSSLRDSVGTVGDWFLDPISYVPSYPIRLGVRAFDGVNELSFRLTDYEDLKRAALDPYVAMRDGYHERREFLVKE